MNARQAIRTIGRGKQAIPVIRLEGGAHERGVQRGTQMGSMIATRVERILKGYGGLASRSDLLRLADESEAALHRRAPDTITELRGMSEGSRIAWDDLRVASLVRTVGFQAVLGSTMRLEAECLCVLASNGATADQHPLLGKNADYVTSVSGIDDLFVMEVVPERGYAHIGIGVYPEKVCQPEGMNERGLAVVGAGQYPSDGRDAFAAKLPTGPDIYQLYGDILSRCATVQEAIDAMREPVHGYTGRVMILADATGAWAKVEMTYATLKVYEPEPEAFYATNHVAAGTSGVFSSRETQAMITDRSARPGAYRRYDHTMDLLVQHAGRIDVSTMQAILRDHFDGAGLTSPCKHVDPAVVANQPPLEALPTLSSVVFEPATRRAWLTKGAPCVSEFVALTVPTAERVAA